MKEFIAKITNLNKYFLVKDKMDIENFRNFLILLLFVVCSEWNFRLRHVLKLNIIAACSKQFTNTFQYRY